MKTINIKGKEYVTVNERLKEFREQHPDYSLTTTIVQLDEMSCTMQATILDELGRVLAMGTAREERDDKASVVNKTSYVENCETSAWGRALGNFGIGIDESVASADEVAFAIKHQENDAINQQSFKPTQTAVKQPQEAPSFDSLLMEAKTTKFKSGKHEGECPFDVRTKYLEYLVQNGKNEHFKAVCQAVLDDRYFEQLDSMKAEEDLPF